MPFDVAAAREAGYSDDEIIDYLSKEKPKFDVSAAKNAGYDSDEIIHYLQTGKPYQRSGSEGNVIDLPDFGKGVETGLRDTAKGVVNFLTGPFYDVANTARSLYEGYKAGEMNHLFATDEERAAWRQRMTRENPSGEAAIGSVWKAPYESLEDLPPEARPWAVGGEFVGSGIPMVAGALAAGATVPEAALATAKDKGGGAGVIAKVLQTAKDKPIAFAAKELKDLAYGGIGGGVAEVVAPDSPLARFIGELGGGLWSTGVTGALEGASAGVNAAKEYVSTGAREARAAKIIQGAVKDTGEEPNALASVLRKPDDSGLQLTAGQKAQSPALNAIEQRLAEQSPKFKGELANRETANLGKLKSQLSDLSASGNPDDLRKAAQVRNQYFNDMIDDRLDLAQRQINEANAAFDARGKAGMAETSQAAKQALESAYDDAKSVERELWSKVPKDIEVQPLATMKAFRDIKASLLPNEKLSEPVENFIGKFVSGAEKADMSDAEYMTLLKGEGLSPTSGNLLRLRSRALDLARDARSQGRASDAAFMNNIASAALDDLNTLSLPAAQAARDFTRTLHDKFTRTFAGQALAKNATGAERITPDMVLERAFGTGGTQGARRFGELQSAAEFGDKARAAGANTEEGLPLASDDMANAQERFLRLAANATVDRTTGRVNEAKLGKFLEDNNAVLSRFPELKDDLANAATAETAFKNVEALTGKATSAAKQRKAFGQLLDNEDPTDAVARVLNGRTPEQSYTALVNLAKKSGPGAVSGLKTSTLDYAVGKAMDSDGKVDFVKLSNALREPLAKGRRSPIQIMEQSGTLSASDSSRLKTILDRGYQIQSVGNDKTRLDDLVKNADALSDLLVRMASAKAGTVAAHATGGQSLVLAGAASKFGQTLLNKIPNSRIRDVLQRAVTDPELMATLLEKPTTATKAKEISTRLHAALLNAGLLYGTSEDEGE